MTTKAKTTTEQGHHYYASTVVAWAADVTRAKAIARVIRNSKSMFKPNADGGIYVFSVRVDLPKSANYTINNYVPVDVPMSEKLEGSFKMHKGTPVHLQRVED